MYASIDKNKELSPRGAFPLRVGVTEAERALAEPGDNTKMIDAVKLRSPNLVTES